MDKIRYSSNFDFTKVDISIVGKYCAITLPISLDTIKKIERYRPEALQIKDENDKLKFKVASGTTGSISDHGVTFNDVTRDERQLAVMTIEIKGDVKDARAYIASEYGKAILNLKEVVAHLGKATDSIEEEMDEVLGYIRYADVTNSNAAEGEEEGGLYD